MSNISICKECNGIGSYKVLNAYDPTASEEVICEHCDGDGSFTSFEGKGGTKPPRDESILN